jgi:tetratricopeptide (TPR) repeat protein
MPRAIAAMLASAATVWPLLSGAEARQSPRSPEPATGPALVMPFDNVARDGRIFWMSEASAVVLADDLQALGVDAIGHDERRQALERLQVPHVASLADATIIRIGQIVGAAVVVIGSLELDGETLTVRARSIALDSGRVRTSITESGPLPQMFATFERVARRLAPPSTTTTAEVLERHPPLPAFEEYIKGLLAETPATAINYLRSALALHPPFDRARLALWDVHTDQGNHEQALVAVQQVASTSPLARPARFRAGLSQLSLQRLDDAFAAFKAMADADPVATVLNNLGVVQLQRGGTPQSGDPTYFFTKAADADPDDPDYFFNLGYAYWLQGEAESAIYWLREAVRRDPTDGEAHYVLGAALAVGGGTSGEAAREKELARRLSSTFEEWDKRPTAEQIPRGLERLKPSLDVPRRIAMAATGQRDQDELVRFHLDRGRRLFEQNNDREALMELNRALFLSPYQAEAQLLTGRIRLRAGQVDEAIDALKISLWSHETAEAHVALGEALLAAEDFAGAREEAERAIEMNPSLDSARRLLDRIGPR